MPRPRMKLWMWLLLVALAAAMAAAVPLRRRSREFRAKVEECGLLAVIYRSDVEVELFQAGVHWRRLTPLPGVDDGVYIFNRTAPQIDPEAREKIRACLERAIESRRLAEHYEKLAEKYEAAAHRPWLSVSPDPPEPERRKVATQPELDDVTPTPDAPTPPSRRPRPLSSRSARPP